MSSTDVTAPVSARLFLLGDDTGADTAEVPARSLEESGVAGSAIQGLRGLSTSALQAVHREAMVFELKVEFDLNGVVAVVRRGDLVALRCGECVVTAPLTLQGTSLKRSRKSRIDLPLAVRINPAIPLTRQGN